MVLRFPEESRDVLKGLKGLKGILKGPQGFERSIEGSEGALRILIDYKEFSLILWVL